MRLIQEWNCSKICFAPNAYVGWLANVPLGSVTTSQRFVDAPPDLFFSTQGVRQTTNQLVLGAEFYMQRLKAYELTANFEADLLSQFEVYTVKLKFQWLF